MGLVRSCDSSSGQAVGLSYSVLPPCASRSRAYSTPLTVPLPSDDCQCGRRLSASRKVHQPFEILGGGRQVELLRHVPKETSAGTRESYPQLQLREQRFDLVPLAPVAGVEIRPYPSQRVSNEGRLKGSHNPFPLPQPPISRLTQRPIPEPIPVRTPNTTAPKRNKSARLRPGRTVAKV